MAVRADASNEYFRRTTGTFYSTTTMSVCFWAVLDVDRNASGALWGLYGTGDKYHVCYNANGDGTTMVWEVDGGGTTAIVNMTVGTWYFFGHTRNGTGVNGAQTYVAAQTAADLTTTQGSFTSAVFTPNAEVALTNNFSLATGWINGRMAALKQWNAVLTANEMRAERWSMVPQRLLNLYSWYPFLANSAANAALDYGGSARNFTVTGTPTMEAGPPIAWGVKPYGSDWYAGAAPPAATVAPPPFRRPWRFLRRAA